MAAKSLPAAQATNPLAPMSPLQDAKAEWNEWTTKAREHSKTIIFDSPRTIQDTAGYLSYQYA